MNTQHTPGPWYAARTGPVMMGYSQPWGVHNGETQLIAGAFGDVVGGEEQAKANARLIAAAPDLLEAVKTALEWIESSDDEADTTTLCSIMHSAISKAEGK